MPQPVITHQQYKRVCQLATLSGFMKAYFDYLPKTRTYNEAFDTLNEEYFEHFGEYRYSSWKSFHRSLTHYTQNK